MPRTNFQELLDAGVHFGHLKRKWNPKMAPYIFMEKNGIHIIDLHKTVIKIEEAANVMKQLARAGRKILFVATKKQAKDIVAENAKAVNMPYVTERWPGGMLTNFPTIRKAVKKMNTIDKMLTDGTFETLAKRERLQVTRQRAKLEKNLGSIADLNRLPSALFIIDVQKEMNAVREANRLNIPVIAMVDTCCDPGPVDYVIPANDDAAKSISYIMGVLSQAVAEGLSERKFEKEKEGTEDKESTHESGKDLSGKRIRTRKPGTAQSEPAQERQKSEPAQEKAPVSPAVVVEKPVPTVAVAEESASPVAVTEEPVSPAVNTEEPVSPAVTTEEPVSLAAAAKEDAITEAPVENNQTPEETSKKA